MDMDRPTGSSTFFTEWLRRLRESVIAVRPEGRQLMMEEESYVPWIEGEMESQDELPMWGWSEAMGWKQHPDLGLAVLGEPAEEKFRLTVAAGQDGMIEYFTRLQSFARSLPLAIRAPFINSIHSHLPASHRSLVPLDRVIQKRPSASMISYKNIHQTDRNETTLGEETQAWVNLNKPDGWALNFLNDTAAARWVTAHFADSDIEWAWNYMHRGVLRADLLRYLLLLVEGGVYSDIDTLPLRPIEQWGHTNPEYLDISATDGKSWRSLLTASPAVIVAIDVDVHSHPDWAKGWPRPLGICQWTISSAPSHPIFLDAVRRVVNSTRIVEAWENLRAQNISRIEKARPPGWQYQVTQLLSMRRSRAMNVMEWTGPGLFTDAVLAFLLTRYHVTWHRLRGLDHPLRVGDVMILPITAFSPGGEPDFRAETSESPQANVVHGFRASWKQEDV
ncbi:MAG: membrane-bound alpha-1,6- mannosyltransferase Initiation-specific [Tremellales sp. Tagirdzhanova-0007]|nr:MAG: membrane-bound alpha-1,6- mannosyltransferase Initiation-specific [Tremellales sp. Tagirdzhanova-0007]